MEELRRSLRQRAPWFVDSYIGDWALLAVLAGAVVVFTVFANPHQRLILPNDVSVTYPLEPDIVSPLMLVVITIVLPISIFLLSQLWMRSSFDLHNTLLAFFQAFVVCMVFTSVFKFYAGRPRPDHFAMQSASPGIKDAWLSFPSGHSSSSFCSMTFVALWLAAKLGLYSGAGGHFYKYLLTCMPMMLACFVACSRTRDFHHFYADVVGGAVLGLVIAVGCYHLNYPALWEADCHLPRLRCGKSQASRNGAYEQLDLMEAGTPTTASPSPPPSGHTAYLTMPAVQRSLSPQLRAV
jgi:membrane-associated phospholipid phosphatase